MTDSKNSSLVWMDLEMTGLNLEKDHIVEIATIITDNDLNIVATGPDIVIHQSDEEINSMDEWCKKTFAGNGLIDRMKESHITAIEAEHKTLEFIKQHCPAGTSPLCGNSVYNDRMFIKKYMQELNTYLHYRLIDVSTLKELYERWMPAAPVYEKKDSHRALDDIKESIEELKFYRKIFFNK